MAEVTAEKKNYAIDAGRVRNSSNDPDAPDAVWIPVVSTDRDLCASPEAQIDVQKYAATKLSGPVLGIDRIHGPLSDNGDGSPAFNAQGPANQAETSVAEYLGLAAHVKMNESRNSGRYITWFRVRRDV